MAEGQKSSITPQLPPTSEEDRFYWLRLLRSRRVSPATFHRLLSEHGSAQAAFEALPEIAAAAGIKDYEPCTAKDAAEELEAGRKFGAVPIYHGALSYPRTLYDLPDAPPLLWAKGHCELLNSPKIAMVGARNASSAGNRMARGLAKELGAAKQVIVSGLARGIDAAAHSAALKTGTIAVLAGGVDIRYPAENAALAAKIQDCGLLLSEQPMGLQPRSRHFPLRNRIISGLSSAVVVVEAATKSGSLITARNALDQGREVLAVPGHPIDSRGSGCNLLIRDGATLVRSGQDVLEAVSPISVPKQKPAPKQIELQFEEAQSAPRARTLRETSHLHRQIMDLIDETPVAENALIRDLNAPAQTTTSALVDLELAGRITRTSGGLLMRS